MASSSEPKRMKGSLSSTQRYVELIPILLFPSQSSWNWRYQFDCMRIHYPWSISLQSFREHPQYGRLDSTLHLTWKERVIYHPGSRSSLINKRLILARSTSG